MSLLYRLRRNDGTYIILYIRNKYIYTQKYIAKRYLTSHRVIIIPKHNIPQLYVNTCMHLYYVGRYLRVLIGDRCGILFYNTDDIVLRFNVHLNYILPSEHCDNNIIIIIIIILSSHTKSTLFFFATFQHCRPNPEI